MNTTGIMWYDNDPKKPSFKKIKEGMEHCQKKYGWTPVRCEVNPKNDIAEGDVVISVVKRRNILPNHYFLMKE
jgi:hypothetical protein